MKLSTDITFEPLDSYDNHIELCDVPSGKIAINIVHQNWQVLTIFCDMAIVEQLMNAVEKYLEEQEGEEDDGKDQGPGDPRAPGV